jgi:hypothetical protein
MVGHIPLILAAATHTKPHRAPSVRHDHAVHRDKPAYRASAAAATAITPLIAVFGHPRAGLDGTKGPDKIAVCATEQASSSTSVNNS